jgi:predicted small lipoprotein YifL
MKRHIAIFLTLALLLTLAACAAEFGNAPPPLQEEPPAEPAPAPKPKPLEKPFPGKIAIVTNNISQSEEEYCSAQQVVEKYGADKVVHKTSPLGYMPDPERIINLIRQIAADPDIKALIINQAGQHTLAAVDKLLETRDDIFLVVCQPTEYPPDVVKRFNLILNTDEVGMVPAMVQQAQKLGAKTFVHLSFPRHMGYTINAARYKILQEECDKLGLNFVSHTVPDPWGDIGMAGAQQVMLKEIPKLVKEYGQDTAFFCTNCGLQIPLIKAVVDCGAIYPQPCCPSPYHGFPVALGLISEEDARYTGRLPLLEQAIFETTRILKEDDMLGRVSTWPVPTAFLFTHASAEYAIKWLNGEVPKEDIDIAVLEQCMADYAGVECFARTLGTHKSDLDISDQSFSNWLLVREGYLTFGEEHVEND